MLVHRDEDVKSEASTNAVKDSIFAIFSIFQSIKCSEDIVDAAKSKVGRGYVSVIYKHNGVRDLAHPRKNKLKTTKKN